MTPEEINERALALARYEARTNVRQSEEQAARLVERIAARVSAATAEARREALTSAAKIVGPPESCVACRNEQTPCHDCVTRARVRGELEILAISEKKS